jgi:hypothetical protein
MRAGGGHGEKLTHKQERAIGALLTSKSLIEAAELCQIGETTLRRWLTHPGFQAAYLEARRAVVQHALTALQQASMEAVETLRAVQNDVEASASAKVSAAKTVLELALRAVEFEDLEARIARLEQAQGDPL